MSIGPYRNLYSYQLGVGTTPIDITGPVNSNQVMITEFVVNNQDSSAHSYTVTLNGFGHDGAQAYAVYYQRPIAGGAIHRILRGFVQGATDGQRLVFVDDDNTGHMAVSVSVVVSDQQALSNLATNANAYMNLIAHSQGGSPPGFGDYVQQLTTSWAPAFVRVDDVGNDVDQIVTAGFVCNTDTVARTYSIANSTDGSTPLTYLYKDVTIQPNETQEVLAGYCSGAYPGSSGAAWVIAKASGGTAVNLAAFGVVCGG